MRIRTRVINTDGAWRVDLPTYTMVPASFDTTTPAYKVPDVDLEVRVHPDGISRKVPLADRTITCLVDVPDNYANAAKDGVDAATLRKLHKGHPRWDDAGRPPDV